MDKLIIFNLILIAIISVGIFVSKRCIKNKRGENILLLVAALVTIILHYSSFLYQLLTGGNAIEYLNSNPNLILPIYPCNVVMWSALIYALCKNKASRLCNFLADYIFWFGLVSTLVGMFANVDFIREPTLANYEVTKSIVAHATLLFNLLLLPVFGQIKVELWKNMWHIIVSILEMLVIGAYCNLVFEVIGSADVAYNVNSMFLIHSPFDGAEFLTYPTIALIALPIYFTVFAICELFTYKRGERFYNRLLEKLKTIR